MSQICDPALDACHGTDVPGIEDSVGQKILDAFFSSSPLLMTVIDEQLRYVKVNKTWADWLGKTAAEMEGRPVRDFVPALYLDSLEELFKKVIVTGESRLNLEINAPENSIHTSSCWLLSLFPVPLPGNRRGVGAVSTEVTKQIQAEVTALKARELEEKKAQEAEESKPVPDAQGKVSGGFIAWRDVTERKEMEQELNRQYEELRKFKDRIYAIIESISDGFFALDTNWNFTYINKRAANNGHFEPEELLGRNIWEKMPALVNTELYPAYHKVMDSKVPLSFEWYFSGHSTAWYQVNVYPAPDGVCVYWTDITEKKEAERVLRRDKETLAALVAERSSELIEMHHELERTRRMADIGRLAATIAHEMRNPLSAIKLAAYNIRRKANNSLLTKHLDTIDRKVLESDYIIRNLLNFSRIKQVNFELQPVRQILEECIVSIKEKYLRWPVRVVTDWRCREDAMIEADYTQIRILFSNIIDNAFQALPQRQGTVTLSISGQKNGEYEITIADTGTGMYKEDLERAFEPFFTTKSKGTGLGLPVCKEIAELHKGRIMIRSTKEEGTTVSVVLPAYQPA